MLRISYHQVYQVYSPTPSCFSPEKKYLCRDFCLHHKGESIASQL